MVYVESSPLFCAETKTAKDRALSTLHARGSALDHPLETLEEALPPDRDAHQEHQEAKEYDTWRKLNPQSIWVALAHI